MYKNSKLLFTTITRPRSHFKLQTLGRWVGHRICFFGKGSDCASILLLQSTKMGPFLGIHLICCFRKNPEMCLSKLPPPHLHVICTLKRKSTSKMSSSIYYGNSRGISFWQLCEVFLLFARILDSIPLHIYVFFNIFLKTIKTNLNSFRRKCNFLKI